MAGYPTNSQFASQGTTVPWSSSTFSGKLANVGYAEAKDAVATLAAVGFRPPVVWVDVEPRPAQPWLGDSDLARARNRWVVTGLLRGLHDAGYAYGLYSYASGWTAIAGSWRLPGVPVWATAAPHRGRRPRHVRRTQLLGRPGAPRPVVRRHQGQRRDLPRLRGGAVPALPAVGRERPQRRLDDGLLAREHAPGRSGSTRAPRARPGSRGSRSGAGGRAVVRDRHRRRPHERRHPRRPGAGAGDGNPVDLPGPPRRRRLLHRACRRRPDGRAWTSWRAQET